VSPNHPSLRKERRKKALCACIFSSLELYFKDLDGHVANNVYEMVISEVEKPLFEIVMQQTRGNQTKAAALLGINRSTLRKKLEHYKLS